MQHSGDSVLIQEIRRLSDIARLVAVAWFVGLLSVVAPCLALPFAGNLRKSMLDQILKAMNRHAVRRCFDRSSCNMRCSRVVGSSLRHPISALMTPRPVPPGAQ